MTGAESLQLFQQLVANANSLFLSDADFVAINGISKPTLKKIYAEFLASMGTYTTVAAGLAATSGTGTNNRFFSVPGTGDVFETRYRNDAGVAVEISSLLSWLADALTINKGKAYPLRQMNRGGVTSPANPVMNRFLLNCEVLGADLSKYYLISLQKNGASLGGSYEFGWILYEADPATYASTGAVTEIHGYVNPAPTIDRSGGIQTLIVTPNLRPDMRFKIVVDASQLPASGTAIDSNSTSAPGRSWIVDPSRYSAPPVVRDDSLTINKGKNYPLRQKTRGSTSGAITSPANSTMNSLLLGVEITGAEAGKYYLISYQQNQQSIGGDADFGWILYEADAATYETTGAITQIHGHVNPAPNIDRAGGVQTITVTPQLRQNMRFRITLDASALPPAGTPIDANSTGAAGRSWIVDPSCYFVADSQAVASKQLQAGRMWVEGETTGNNFDFVWSHGSSQMFMLKFGPNQVNQLFNFKGWKIAPLTNVGAAAWEDLGGWNTDWFPPMTIQAVNNGDGGKGQYTGGGHWDESDPTEQTPTAKMANLKCSVNGQMMPAGQVYSGPASEATFTWTVDLMAYNTLTVKRYVGRQHFTLHVKPGSAELMVEFEALEDVIAQIDNGPQMGVYTAFPEWVHYLGDNRGPLLQSNPDSVSAQNKTLAPEVFAAVCYHPTRGFCASWLDRTYEAGDGRYVSPTLPFARRNSGSWKFYQAVISGVHTTFQPGQGYKWRGGYAVAPNEFAAGDVNCGFLYHKGGKPWLAWGLDADGGSGRVKPVPSVAGRAVGGSVVGTRGLSVSAAAYAFGNAEVQ